MKIRTEPFIYGIEEVEACDGHLDPNQAVACENVPVIGMLDDNKALATEGEFLPEPESNAVDGEEPITPENPEPVVDEPTEPTTNDKPTVEP